MVDLVVETGTGLPTANSFLTVDEADEILEVNPHSLWSLNTEPVKEGLLIWATRLLSERTRWNGRKRYENAGTPFPRRYLWDADGIKVTDTDVPKQVKTATALLADYLATVDPTTVNASSNLVALEVDVVKLQFDAHLKPARWPSSVRIALGNLGDFSPRGPKRIIKC